MLRNLILFCSISLCIASCKEKSDAGRLPTGANLLHQNMNALTRVIIHDVFSPPVSSRIYSYTSLAAYEALRFEKGEASIAAQLKGFNKLPEPQKAKTYNYLLAATKAFFTVSEKVTFSIDTLKQYQDKVYQQFKDELAEDVFNNSISFGEEVGKAILTRTTVDNY
ncbi:MAG TPA: hypothetical protein VM935_14140, partial [Chitinophagaceae bacterium]|nr:hypothetical protein [Chitinophagaceae bacterium]